ncbi:hypothetical protein BC831DRAFT_554770 [Entophlyctis helioformis]|nr:hypothetical protein BC831DRAFT_554770 [Entophlyctis helioformis]
MPVSTVALPGTDLALRAAQPMPLHSLHLLLPQCLSSFSTKRTLWPTPTTGSMPARMRPRWCLRLARLERSRHVRAARPPHLQHRLSTQAHQRPGPAPLRQPAQPVTELNDMEAAMTQIRHKYGALRSSFGRVKTRLSTQFSQIQSCHTHVERAQALNETLRQVDRFLQLVTRIDSLMANGPSEYATAAIHLFELEGLLSETDLSGIVVVDQERDRIAAFKLSIEQHAETQLSSGLAEQDQTRIAEALQIYSNMHAMPSNIKHLLERYMGEILKEIQTTFDVITLNAEMKQIQQRTTGTGGVRRVNEPPAAAASSNVAVWANLLWGRAERLTDVIYNHAAKLYLLDTVLSRKRDPVSRVSFLEEVVQLIGGPLAIVFWRVLAQTLDKEIKLATKASQFLLQVLQAGYPRFLRVFHDLFTRVALISGHTFNETEKSPESQTLLKILASFESAYVSRSLTRLLDVVNMAFPEKPHPGQRTVVSRDDVDKIVRTVSSEVDVVKFDGHLLRLASKNILKALSMYTVKCEHLSPTDNSAYQVGGASLSSSQQLNIDIVNALWYLQDSVWRLLEDYEETAADGPMTEAMNSISKLIQGIVEPMLTNFANDIESTIVKMHKEDYAVRQSTSALRNTPARQPDSTSAYVAELLAKLRWIVREIFARLQCGDDLREWVKATAARVLELVMRHATLVRPLNEHGKLKLTADMTQLEYFLSQVFATFDMKLDVDLAESLRSLRALRPLLFLELPQLASSTQIAHLSPVLVMHHIMVRAHPVIPMPQHVFSWTDTEYSEWLDTHSLPQALEVLDKCLTVYVNDVTRRGETQFCVEYPLLRSILSEHASNRHV